MQFQIEIIETLVKVVDITADTVEDAIDSCTNLYDSGEITLDCNNHIGAEFVNITQE